MSVTDEEADAWAVQLIKDMPAIKAFQEWSARETFLQRRKRELESELKRVNKLLQQNAPPKEIS